jgi:hypothetical protein
MGTPKPLSVSLGERLKIRAWLIGKFPNLSREKFSPESESTFDYNCIAWAAGDIDDPWWPHQDPQLGYWPITWRAEKIECFVEAFRVVGNYEECGQDFGLEQGYEKVALYVNDKNEPKHMARQLPTGLWTSKMGVEGWDIIHETVHGIEGDVYGHAVLALRRPIQTDE